MNKGFIIVAQNNETTDYVTCARVLCRSIKSLMPEQSVTLLTDKKLDDSSFDNIITFPYGDQCANDIWKLANDWQVYEASPYDYTIKLEADIYLPRSIDYWWDVLMNHDLVLCTTIRDYHNKISKSRAYRKLFDDNKLPDVYNAITYFKKGDVAKNFFTIVKNIFEKWDDYRVILNTNEPATTDVVYGIAASIIGAENCTLPAFRDMSMIHMKSGINYSKSSNWTDEFIYEIHHDTLRIGTIPQMYPFHYHVKSFANILSKELYE